MGELEDTKAQIEKILGSRTGAVQYETLLLNLLAVIHRDGGHYTEKYGVEHSVQQAMIIVSDLVVR